MRLFVLGALGAPAIILGIFYGTYYLAVMSGCGIGFGLAGLSLRAHRRCEDKALAFAKAEHLKRWPERRQILESDLRKRLVKAPSTA